jgi:ABC-2 type transport system permease protein
MVNEDNSSLSQGLVMAFKSVSAFEVHEGGWNAESDAIKKGDRRAVIVIPTGFEQSILHGSQYTVTVYYDASESTSQQVVLPIIRQVVDGFDRAIADALALIQVENGPLQSQHLRAIDYLVPGILAMALM